MTSDDFDQLQVDDIIIATREGTPGWTMYKAGKTSIPKFVVTKLDPCLGYLFSIIVEEIHVTNGNQLTIKREFAPLYSKAGRRKRNRVNLIEIN